MREAVSLILMLIGALFMLIAAVGVARLPDLYTRMSATSKSATLGAVSVLLSAAVYFSDFAITSRIVAIIAFLFLTAPVAAHRIARAAYITGVPLWRGTVIDELRGRYDAKTHGLASQPSQTGAVESREENSERRDQGETSGAQAPLP